MNPFEIAVFAACAALAYLVIAMLVTRLSLALDWPRTTDEALADGMFWPLTLPVALSWYVVRSIVGFVRWGAGL